jgi:hypothetical protein
VQRAEVATLWATSGKRDEGEAGADTWTVRSQRRRPRRGGSSGVAAAATGTKRVDGFFFFSGEHNAGLWARVTERTPVPYWISF